MHRDLPPLAKAELFERLSRGLAAGIAVVTPNRRLAQSVQAQFDALQAGRGLAAWETADVLPFDALVLRLWEDALYSEIGAEVPIVLSAAQEQALWEEAIHATRHAQTLFSTFPAAAQCRAAWRLLHAWRLDPARAAPNEDARAFLDWAARYERATRENRQTDSARLPDVVAPWLASASVRKPATLVLFGFDLVTPQVGAFLDALAARGCEVVEAAPAARAATVARIEFAEARDEIEAAARWARSRLERGAAGSAPRIAVVVPDLGASRSRVRRAFADAMRPGHALEDSPAAMPFNISLGAPLAEAPMVADALLVLELAGRDIAFEDASRVLRSPFIAGAESEMEVRARLDARLRERCAPRLTLDALARACAAASVPRAPVLVDVLSRLAQFRKSALFGAHPASQWAKAFSEALRIAGFPGERALDSAEHQTLDKWHELVVELATLERVTGRMGFNAARERLRHMAREEVFQPEAPEAPVQVLGILESAGQEFDHLWVMGLTDEAWPLAARPDPFIPVAAQRAAGIPQADPVSSLELDRRITQGWMRSAGEVVLSHARMKKEAELAPSPLIASIARSSVDDLGLAPRATLREAIRAGAVLESIEDANAPAIAEASQPGGTGLFKDQAACPFRAFARRRVRSRPLEAPQPGLDARERGNLVHDMMRGLWKSLQTHERLSAADDAALQALAAACADEAIARVRRHRPDVLAGRFARLERERLVRLAMEWLDVERGRPAFEVVAAEEKRPIAFGGVSVNAKLDRMDRLAAGGHAIIDYKTGACRTSDWMGPRPEEPQLPMYALGGGEDVAAVAFAVVRSGEARFRGISRAPGLMPDVCTVDKERSPAARRYRDWNALLAGWRVELEATGRGFAAGDARVDPKRGRDTCKNCDQQMFCRIAEKAPFDAAAEGDGDE